MSSLGLTGRLSVWSARRHWLVISGWIVAAVVITGISSVTGSRLTTDIEFSNSPESQTARELLQEARGSEPFFEQVIVQSDRYTVDDPEFGAFVTELTAAIRSHEEAIDPLQTFSYFEVGDPSLVSESRQTTIVPTLLRGEIDEATEHVKVLQATLAEFGGREDFSVLTLGFASSNAAFTQAAEGDLAAEFRALPIAMVVLVLVFGAVIAALLPMGIAFMAIGITFGLVALISQVYEMSFFVTNVMMMIGLAVGIDYALFIVARYREQREQGQGRSPAIGVAGDTAGRAVVFSGVTVVIALMGMFVVPTSIFRSFAIGASAVVLVTIVASVTLLPALLSLMGDRINGLSIPFIGGASHHGEDEGFWAGTARFVMRYPLVMALGTTTLLVVMSIPYFSISLGFTGINALPPRYEARQAFEILDQEFSAGRIQPTDIVIQADDVNSPAVQAAIDEMSAAIAADPTYALVNGTQVLSPALAVVSVAVPGEAASDEAITAMKFLRTDIVPEAFSGVAANVYVGGPTAGNADFFDQVAQYTPWVFAFVLGFSLVLLTLIFRSVVVPVKSIIMNLLSVGAAYGVVVAVFQWGWGADALGFTQVDAIEAWLPLFMFTILFGLSMDYHIFLLTRIRERFDETHDNAGSVAYGLRHTANLITGAAAIMVAVFGGFALGDLAMFQQIGLGLAVSVFLDATVVRTVLVPSTMRLLGDFNWYMPSWLQWLPDLRVEREPAIESLEAPVPAAEPEPATASR
ncbi:MAG: MMPL family transporter [Dehalococcoidia bacterium]|nr:MMPL family transporter [Dehalococcoidia bacterium]